MPILAPLLSLLAAGTTTTTPAGIGGMEVCKKGAEEIQTPCVKPQRWSLDTINRLMAEKESLWWVVGDELTMVGRLRKGGEARLCCAIQSPLQRVEGTRDGNGNELGSITVRIPNIDHAWIDVTLLGGPSFEVPEVYKGKLAPPLPETKALGKLEGKITVENIASSSLDAPRTVSIYTPPAKLARGKKLPVIYLADGEVIHGYAQILEAAMDRGAAPPAMIVGIHSAKGVAPNCHVHHCERRNLEYIPDSEHLDGDDFKRHMAFVVNDVVDFIDKNYPTSTNRRDRIVAGFSSGAVWAFSAAAFHSDVFGAVLGMSSGSASTVKHASRLRNTDVYAGAGSFEPKFLDATKDRIELIAGHSGNTTSFQEVASGHSSLTWDILFHDGANRLLKSRPIVIAQSSPPPSNRSEAGFSVSTVSLQSGFPPTSRTDGQRP